MVWRSALSLLLAAVLALASQSLAVARANGAAGGLAVEICAEGGTATVILDARGKPVGPVHLCPDCVAALAYALPAAAVQPARPAGAALTVALPPGQSRHARHPPAPPARGPPALA